MPQPTNDQSFNPPSVSRKTLVLTLGGYGRLTPFERPHRASESFLERLRQIGASDEAIRAAEGSERDAH